MGVTGFQGHGLVNSFLGGDKATGTLTSPEFKIERKYISFLVGGGGFEGKTCINLVIDGKTVRTATGPNKDPGGSEELEPGGWDVTELMGKSGKIEIVDQATGGWGHINVDHIVFTDTKPALSIVNAAREFRITDRYLLFPVRTGATKKIVTVSVDGKEVRSFEIELDEEGPQWWAPLDVSAWKGQSLTVRVNKLRRDSHSLAAIKQADQDKNGVHYYREPLRPQLHFSAKRGWLNDPNGLVYFNGQYHLFFQHNPYGWAWGNMHWGHAISQDLIHWTQQEEALYPDAMGPMFSGSGVVDWNNTSGFGKDGEPPLVLIYTAAGNPTVQCLAYSNDNGATFRKCALNPVVKQITGGNRDPKVFWHEPTKKWVMALYVELAGKHTVHFLTSPDLKQWTNESKIDGFFECPDIFSLPVDGDSSKLKWILTAADHGYMVGTFDGKTFVPETTKLPGNRGKGFYAAQTFSDIPSKDGRRIQIGWLQAESRGMAFNQAMTVPLEVKLVTTVDGPRLTWMPVRELETLRGTKIDRKGITLKPGDKNPLENAAGDLFDIVVNLEPGNATEAAFAVRGISVVYSVEKKELLVNGQRVLVPLLDGKLRMRILADRTAFEVFANDGLVYVPVPVVAKADSRGIVVSVMGGPVRFDDLAVYPMKSIWEK